MRPLYLIPLIVFAALSAVLGYLLLSGHDPAALPSALIDKEAPSFDLPPLDGAGPGLSSADLEGKVVLVNFFASWCVPCRAEHPLLMRLAEEENFPIYGIDYKDKPDEARAWLDALGNPFDRIGADRDGRVAIDWGVYGVPETYVVDATGRIRFRHAAPLMPADVEETLLPLLRELSR